MDVSGPSLKDLKKALRKTGFRPSKTRGQNFLFDHGMLEAIAADAELRPDDKLLEIGSGCGFLTGHLAQYAGSVLAVEIDRVLAAVSNRFLASWGNIEVLVADILREGKVNPEVAGKLRETGICDVVAGNLPYSAATAVIAALSDWEFEPRALVFLLQEEVALRIGAGPGEPDRCALSVISQAAFTVELLRKVGSEVFWPRPKVQSRLVRLTPRGGTDEFSDFRQFVFMLFAQPRKTVLNSLTDGAGRAGPLQGRESKEIKQIAVSVLNSAEIDPKTRPGQLSEAQIKAIYRQFQAQIQV